MRNGLKKQQTYEPLGPPMKLQVFISMAGMTYLLSKCIGLFATSELLVMTYSHMAHSHMTDCTQAEQNQWRETAQRRESVCVFV